MPRTKEVRRYGERLPSLCRLLVLVLPIFFPDFYPARAESNSVLQLTPSMISFEEILEGEKVAKQVTITNVGSMPILVHQATSDCGCIVTQFTGRTLQPKESFSLDVRFYSKGFSGPQQRQILIETSEPERKVYAITLRGNVRQRLAVSPSEVRFGSVSIEATSALTRTFSVSLVRSAPRKVSSNQADSSSEIKVRSLSRYLLVSPRGSSDGLQRTFSVQIAPDVPEGPFSSAISVSIKEGTQVFRSIVPVVATIVGPISVSPSVVSFGIVEPTEVDTKKVKVKGVALENAVIESVKTSTPELFAQVDERTSIGEQTIQVGIDGSKLQQGERPLQGTVVFQLNNQVDVPEQYRTIKVIAFSPPIEQTN